MSVKPGCSAAGGGGLFLTTLVIFLFSSVMLLPYLEAAREGRQMGMPATGKHSLEEQREREGDMSDKKVRKGLYATATNSLVRERGPAFVQESIAAGKSIICVWYATWCPHCKTYAPTFLRLARQYSKQYDTVFAAIDCAEFESECDRMKIAAYPTVMAFNFPKDGKSVLGAFGSQVEGDKVSNYLTKYGMKRQGGVTKGDAPDEQMAEVDGTTTKKQLLAWMEESVTARARTASPALRLADALASLEYLLLSETPRLVLAKTPAGKEAMDALVQLMELVTVVLPPQSREAAWAGLDPGRALRWLRDKRGTISDEKEWRSGLQAAMRTTTKSLRGKSPTSDIVWQVCGVSVVKSKTKSKESAVGAAQGYTCGLWMLFHFLTVAGGVENGSAAGVEAKVVQATIRGTVAQLFTCSSCRRHFLQAFDDCAYNRCAVPSATAEAATSVYPRLQLWLFRLHNAVTMRIFSEKSGPYAETKALRKDSRQVLWPDADTDLGEAQGLGLENVVEPSKVLSHLRASYWEPGWGQLAALPEPQALQALLSS